MEVTRGRAQLSKGTPGNAPSRLDLMSVCVEMSARAKTSDDAMSVISEKEKIIRKKKKEKGGEKFHQGGVRNIRQCKLDPFYNVPCREERERERESETDRRVRQHECEDRHQGASPIYGLHRAADLKSISLSRGKGVSRIRREG